MDPTVCTLSDKVSGEVELQRLWLRWAGSKWRSLDELRPVFERYSYDLFVDPFFGAGSVFFNLNAARRAVLSDANPHLMEFYRHLRADPKRLRAAMTEMPGLVSRRAYYRARDAFNRGRASYRRSAQFFFLNRLCFNGVFRVNQLGGFNVPMGSRTVFRAPSIDDMRETSRRLQSARLRGVDFTQTAHYARRGALFYIDPPYSTYNNGHGFDRYLWPPFREAQLRKLCSYVQSLAEGGASVIVSYAGGTRPTFVPKYFRLKTFKVYRSISVNGSRVHHSEVCAYFP